jgi:tetratricopeptide (TPR) repeat protein
MSKERKKNMAEGKRKADNKRHLFSVLALFFSILFVYSNSINGTWAMDDVALNRPFDIKDILHAIGHRKIAYFTFLLNRKIAPVTPASFRLFNIFLHFLNALLVYVLALRTFRMIFPKPELQSPNQQPGELPPTGANDRVIYYAALFSGLVFALHPLNINAVSYIVQRMASLAAFFVILSVLCYGYAYHASERFTTAALYALSGLFVLLGIFSKENAVMAIPLVMLYDYVFLSRCQGRIFLRRLLLISAIAVFSIGVASLFTGLPHSFIEIAEVFGHPGRPLSAIDRKPWMAVDVYWSPIQHILTECRVISRYMFLILLPFPRFLVFDWWGFPVSAGLLKPITTLFSIMWLAALLFFSVRKIRRYPLLCFGILWYLIALSLESFAAVGADLYFEHRNYLPLVGLVIGVSGQLAVSSQGKIAPKKLVAAAVIFCGALGIMTYSRNFVWHDSVTLWTDTLNKCPGNMRAMMSLGNSYLKEMDLGDAQKYYSRVVRDSNLRDRPYFYNDAAFSLGMLLLNQGELVKAKGLIDTFASSVTSYRPKILRGYYMALEGDTEGALREYDRVLPETQDLDTVIVYTLMGDAYRGQGMWDAAIEKYNRAVALDAAFSAAYYGIATAYMAKRNVDLAEQYYDKTLSFDPDNVLALSDMADLMLIKRAPLEDALAYARRAVSRSPFMYHPYLTMANVLTVMGREKEAEGYYDKAVKHGMPAYMLPFSRARAYFLKGDREKAEYYVSELRKFKNLPENIRSLLGTAKN